MMTEPLDTLKKAGRLNSVFRYRRGPDIPCPSYQVSPEDMERPPVFNISFQDGERNDPYSRTGMTESDLLEIVRDRLRDLAEVAPIKTRIRYGNALLQVVGALEQLQDLEGQ